MPLNRTRRVRTWELLKTLAEDPDESSVFAVRQRDAHRIPITLYGCVGVTAPGPCRIDEDFHCELDRGDVGLLLEYIGAMNCQGVFELRVSEASPDWVFKQNRARTLRLPVVPHAWRPTRPPPAGSLAQRFWRKRRRRPQITDPELIQLVALRDDGSRSLPKIDVTLVMEYAECVAPSLSLLQVPPSQPLPLSGAHLSVFKMLLAGAPR